MLQTTAMKKIFFETQKSEPMGCMIFLWFYLFIYFLWDVSLKCQPH